LLKIKQFWPFEEISIFSNGGHLGGRAWLSDISFKGNPLRMIPAKFEFPVSLLDVVNCMWSFSFKMSVSFYHLLCYVGLAIVQKLGVF
jgi:hypothetical protein